MHMSSESYFPFMRSKYFACISSIVSACCMFRPCRLYFFALGMYLLMFNSGTPLYDVIWAQMDMCLVLYSYSVSHFLCPLSGRPGFATIYNNTKSSDSDGPRAGRPGFDFSFLHNVQTVSGAQWVPGALSSRIERQVREADHSHPSSAEVKNGGAIPPLPDESSRRGA
jgi:hypothetical protein